MKMIRLASLLALLLLLHTGLRAQCGPNEVEVVVTIVPDQFPTETSWEVRDQQQNLLASGANAQGATFCVLNTLCLDFTIFDSYGDGICCNYGNGSYTVTYGGQLAASGGQFTTQETTTFGTCSPGMNCHFADTAVVGTHTAPNRDFWYIFIPDSTGNYDISTCNNNACNTVIWVYDLCQGLQWDNTNAGTMAYNDDYCGVKSLVSVNLAAGTEYYIRIGDKAADCPGAINWELNYVGPVVGCTDPNACNYNPLATVSDTCYYPGDPMCPDGPDLIVVQSVLESSLLLDQLQQVDPCYVNEGCVTDYGTRDILRFTTHIKNIGNQDYYIGDPNANPQMFTWDNCHNHYHFDGYAEYILYDTSGQPLPIGFKNGFCVIDLECSGGGTAQYSCGNMGITAGCGDIYDRGLECQWIDITDVDPGLYTLVVRTNWDQSPDALGHHELDYLNNWAQVCIELEKVNGQWSVTVDPNCPVYTDCLGQVFGSAVYDCEGVCDGDALFGDLDQNDAQEVADGQQYEDEILANTGTVSTCNDLNGDGDITVTDAAMITACAIRGDNYPMPGGGYKDFCEYPTSVTNIYDTVSLRIASIDYTNQYIDIEIRNPDNRTVGYQFEMSGIVVSGVDNLVPVAMYPTTPDFNSGGMIMGLSYVDSSITKSTSYQPLVRVYFSTINAAQVCISQIVDIVNDKYEDVITEIDGPCLTTVSATEPEGPLQVKVYPNPFSDFTTLEFTRQARKQYELQLMDLSGRVVRDYGPVPSGRIRIEKGDLPEGLYFYRLSGGLVQTGKLLIL